MFVFGILEAPARGWSDPLVYGCLITGCCWPERSGWSNCAGPTHCSTSGCSPTRPDRTSAAAIVVFFVAIFSFLFLANAVHPVGDGV